MSATFPALENKTPRAILIEHSQQFGSRGVKVGGDPLFFELRRLIRTSSGDQGEFRLHTQDFLDLLIT